MTHDPFGPSQLGRLLKCPASYRLSRDEPDLSSDDAQEGTLLHKAFERYWTGDGDWSTELNHEQMELVLKCVEFAEEVSEGSRQTWNEVKVKLGQINRGTADFVALTEHGVVVVDFKFGRKADEESLVLQVSNYAAAALYSIPELQSFRGAVEAWAFFPRLNQRFRWQAGSFAEVDAVIDTVRVVIANAKDDASDPQPGAWCEYCKHLPNCRAVRETTGSALATVDPERLLEHPDKIAHLYDLGTLAEKQFKAVKARIRQILLESPDAIPGIRLVETKARRRVPNLGKLYVRLVPELLTHAEFNEIVRKEVRPADLERTVIAKYYRGRKKGLPTQKEIKERLAEAAGNAIEAGKETKLRRVSEE